MDAVISRISAESSTSVPTSPGVSWFGGSYCAAIGRSRGSRPCVHHKYNITTNAARGMPSGQLLRKNRIALLVQVGSRAKPLSKATATVSPSCKRRGSSADFDAVTGDVHVGILRARAISSGKDIGANIRSAFRKNDARAGGLNGNVPLVAGHIPIEFVVILEEFQRVRNRVLNRNCLRGIVGVRDINFELAIVALAAAFVLECPAARVFYSLYIQE